MQLALRVARRMLGRTAPNPAVGAVIADEATGEVITRGWTQQGGRPHAEGRRWRAPARGRAAQTMYVTLEPCSHHGRTPPCADAIVAAGMRRVVCADRGPQPARSPAGASPCCAMPASRSTSGCARRRRDGWRPGTSCA